MKNNIVIYTAITFGYDNLKDPSFINKNCDYICFTDNTKLKSKIWKFKKFPSSYLDPVRKCRQIKILPHLFLKEYKYSIWVDGNIEIISDINKLIIDCFINNNKYKIFMFKHPKRNCIYKEANECIVLGKDNPEIIDSQIKRYKSENFPEDFGLVESNVILREHNSKVVIEFMENWWEEVLNYSRRDQLSFNYVSWKYKIHYGLLEGNSRNNSDYFFAQNHSKAFSYYIKRIFEKLKQVLYNIQL